MCCLPTCAGEYPLHEAIYAGDLAQVEQLLADLKGAADGDTQHLVSGDTQLNTPLMAAVQVASGAIVSRLLQEPAVQRSINTVHAQTRWRNSGAGLASYSTTALHTALAGWHRTNQPRGALSLQPGHTADDAAQPLAAIVGTLLEAGASPLAGAPRASALTFALEVGEPDAAALLLEHASCGQLELAMLPLSAWPADYEFAWHGIGMVHAAVDLGKCPCA